jgi:hypothetical protein
VQCPDVLPPSAASAEGSLQPVEPTTRIEDLARREHKAKRLVVTLFFKLTAKYPIFKALIKAHEEAGRVLADTVSESPKEDAQPDAPMPSQ